MVEVTIVSGVPRVTFEEPERALLRSQEYLTGLTSMLIAGISESVVQKVKDARQHKRRMKMIRVALGYEVPEVKQPKLEGERW